MDPRHPIITLKQQIQNRIFFKRCLIMGVKKIEESRERGEGVNERIWRRELDLLFLEALAKSLHDN